jgi:phospholipase C
MDHRTAVSRLTGNIGPAKKRAFISLTAAVAVAACVVALDSGTSAARPTHKSSSSSPHTVTIHQATTPVKHVVVIYDENVSFDHYFATYPQAANTDGTAFTAAANTPVANTLSTAGLVTTNPNAYKPTRLTPAQALTCDQNHNYGPEQKAFDNGAMDKFVENTSVDTCTGEYGAPGLAMDYFDGNTVTGLWNYAQQYALADNSFDSNFGPSTPGALNLIAGQTHGFQAVTSTTHAPTTDAYAIASPNSSGVGTVINDPDPAFDDCSDKNHTSTNNLAVGTGKNIGDLLNANGVTWGWFQGGFAPTTAASSSTTYSVCGTKHANIGGAMVTDYSPHHDPFQYYASTSNPHHLPPSSVAAIGSTDQANHNYDLSDFSAALAAGNLPSVSFLKAGEYQDGHAGYSDPIDEQQFLVSQINALEQSKFWASTAVVIAYDDSDGWYDHVASPILNRSADATNDAAICTGSTASIAGGYQDRCGPGPRLPLLVISPYTEPNSIIHTPLEQTSILKFIEDNWSTGQIGDSSFDARATSLSAMFDFTNPSYRRVLLNQDGSVASISELNAEPSSLSTSPSVTIGYGHPASAKLTTTLIDTNGNAPIVGAAETLLKRAGRRGRWTTVTTLNTNSAGVASVVVRPGSSTQYEWTFPASGIHAGVDSGVTTVSVGRYVSAATKLTTTRRGTQVRIWGSATPNTTNQHAFLQQQVEGRWKTLTAYTVKIGRRTMPNHRIEIGYLITFTRAVRGTYRYRVYLAGSSSYAASASRSLLIRIS